jgi:hypothetical protein
MCSGRGGGLTEASLQAGGHSNREELPSGLNPGYRSEPQFLAFHVMTFLDGVARGPQGAPTRWPLITGGQTVSQRRQDLGQRTVCFSTPPGGSTHTEAPRCRASSSLGSVLTLTAYSWRHFVCVSLLPWPLGEQGACSHLAHLRAIVPQGTVLP